MARLIASPAQRSPTVASGPRPFNLSRDVPQVLDLLRTVFRPVMDDPGRLALQRSLSLGNPSWLAMRLNQARTGLAPGFIWEESGRIVGNVSLLMARSTGRFLIANVAVHPDYRHQRIATTLMERTLQEVRKHGGQVILLQVETNNAEAIQLYDHLGYKRIGAIRRWTAATRRVRAPALAQDGPSIRPLRRGEWSAAYALDVETVATDLNWPDPLAPDFYRQTVSNWWQRLFNGRQRECWTVLNNDGRLIGLGRIDSEWMQPHALRLRVAPEGRGEVERPLLAKLLRRTAYLPRRQIRLDHPTGDPATDALLRDANFQAERALLTMRYDVAR